MKNLGKDIERIKQMMKTINEGSFNEPTESEVPLDVRQKSTKIINNFIQNPNIDNYNVSSSDGLFSIAGEPVGDTQYILNYNFNMVQGMMTVILLRVKTLSMTLKLQVWN
jgi:hypothetical protein